MHMIWLSMIHDELCNLNCPCGIHYICDMTLTCKCITLHMRGNIAFHGCGCMVEIKHHIW